MKKICINKVLLSTSIIAISPFFFADQAKSAVQLFGPGTYINPASISLVEKFSITLGNNMIHVKTKFTGSSAGVTGTSNSKKNSPFLPHGQIAYRFSDKVVVGFDLSQPGFINYLNFKNGPVAGYKTSGFIENYSPKVSYQINDQVAVGVGLDIARAHGYKLGTPFGADRLDTSAKGTALGFNAGVLYKILPTTWVSLSYHSQQKFNPKGTATIGVNSVAASLPYTQPGTTTLNLLQILSQEFLVSFTARYIQYKTTKDFVITNVPGRGRFSAPLNYKNTWDASVFMRYQFASQWAGIANVEYYANPSPQRFNTPGLPNNAILGAGVGVQYMPTKEMQVQLFAGYASLKPKLQGANGAPNNSVGKMTQGVSYVDLAVTYKF